MTNCQKGRHELHHPVAGTPGLTHSSWTLGRVVYLHFSIDWSTLHPCGRSVTWSHCQLPGQSVQRACLIQASSPTVPSCLVTGLINTFAFPYVTMPSLERVLSLFGGCFIVAAAVIPGQLQCLINQDLPSHVG
ncbi:hypothetical protein E4T56_gene3963 [Termitomyces sp. T112]|nr:hypothetical protein E4T56_gene3963 [Termitomyces sp. T112]